MGVRVVLHASTAAIVLLAWSVSDGATPPARSRSAPQASASIDSSTQVDHDGKPIPRPAKRDISLYGHMFREGIVEPLSHTFDIPDKILWLFGPAGARVGHEAANANAFDEAPNSTWFTSRNHVRAISPHEIRTGPFGGVVPTKPWTVTDLKKGGFNAGFQIKDANDRKWIVKLDARRNPQASSGASVVSSRLVWAAGYNIPLEQAVTFRRDDLRFDTDVAHAPPGDPPVNPSDLDYVLGQVAKSADGDYFADASLFLPGKVVGPIPLRGKRKDDPNDWYDHENRRDLRGLYVVYSWLNNWDVKAQQSLDMFDEKDGKQGHVNHYLIDVNGSLGAAAEGAKPPPYGYQKRIDFAQLGKRIITLGLWEEPWRKAHQESGIPSVGNFEAKVFHPKRWRSLQQVPPFREMTLRDGYWGAKLVASFSDAQIAAAIDAAHYQDSRAPAYLLEVLTERRDKIARYWFDRVAPLDFFEVQGNRLRFHDLASDIGLAGRRAYEVEIETPEGLVDHRARVVSATEVELPDRLAGGSELSLELSVQGSRAKPVRVDLVLGPSGWVITRVRHA